MLNQIKIGEFKNLFITDIDNTLLGDKSSLDKLYRKLTNTGFELGFGVASGRNVNSIIEIFNEIEFLLPDIIISSVGSEIYVKSKSELIFIEVADWKKVLAEGWNRKEIVDSLKEIKNLKLQEDSEQMEFKISYYIKEETEIEKINQKLNELNQRVKLIVSKNKDLDILPEKSGKGKAIEFLSEKFSIPIKSIIVAGDSGNDEDMLTIGANAIVVGNHSEELKKLKSKENIYFAEGEYAAGILEGFDHYGFGKQ
jgi:sucrose-phosphate synthase